MFLALVHLTARTHASADQPQGGWQGASADQGLHDRPTGIAHDLSEFDQAALGVPAWAKSTMSQCCSSAPIDLAYSSHSTRQGLAVRHSSIWPSCFQSLYNSSICQRSRSSTRASSKRRCLAGTSVIRIVQSASRNVCSEMVCPRRWASREPRLHAADPPPPW